MNTDRELLELAAKAAGIDLVFSEYHNACVSPSNPKVDRARWNPLNSDGDALRLAVQLGITITAGDVMCAASAPGAETHQAELADGDIYAAARRAIVRAAAAIGEQMK